MIKRKMSGVLLALLAVAACQNSETTGVSSDSGSKVALPDSVEIQVQEGTPEKYARFSGWWGDGSWGGKLPHILIVEKVKKNGDVVAVYAVGDAPDWNISRTWRRHQGEISGDILKLKNFPRGAKVNYTIREDSRLQGKYVDEDSSISIELHPIEPR